MASLRIGVVAGCLKRPDPASAAAAARQVGAECLQVSARPPRNVSVGQWADTWLSAARTAGVAIASAVTGFPQEDYSSIEAIHRTGGLVPDDTAEDNVRRVLDAIEFARSVGADLLTFHAGFIPDEPADPVFARLLDRLARCADAAGPHGIRIGLETGQESAEALDRFLAALARPNVGCNFDPANMILYGRQDPIGAVEVLAGHIFQVHAKDAAWSDQPGVLWGKEVPLGQGVVGFPRFLAALRAVGFSGALIIEREAGADPLADIAGGVKFLRSLLG